MSSNSSGDYIPTLDGWRAMAITGVIIAHACRGLPQDALHGLTSEIVLLGQNGVNIFFGLSGFLISMKLLEEDRKLGFISLKCFYLRRAFRILPAALVYLVVAGSLGIFAVIPVCRSEWISSAFFFRNYKAVPLGYGWYTGHYWSLSIEEHFYLLWPVFLLIIGPRASKFLVPILILGVSLWRNLELHHGYLTHVLPGVEVTQRTDIHADSLLCGCMAALLLQSQQIAAWCKQVLRWPVSTMLGLLYLALVAEVFRPHLAILLQAILMPILISATVLHPGSYFGRFLELRPLRWIGKLSYSLYLWQQLFILESPKIDEYFNVAFFQRISLGLGSLVVVAMGSYYWIERPLMRFGHRLAARMADTRAGTKLESEPQAFAIPAGGI